MLSPSEAHREVLFSLALMPHQVAPQNLPSHYHKLNPLRLILTPIQADPNGSDKGRFEVGVFTSPEANTNPLQSYMKSKSINDLLKMQLSDHFLYLSPEFIFVLLSIYWGEILTQPIH